MAAAIIGPKFYGWDDNGDPLAYGKLYTYEPGTTTPKPTYTNEDGLVENSNPVVLNGAGWANVHLNGSYAMRLTDLNDNEIWTEDPVTDAPDQVNEWVNQKNAEYVTPSQFKVLGNQTGVYSIGRSVLVSDVIQKIGFVLSSTFLAGETFVEITIDQPLTTSVDWVRVGIFTEATFPQGAASLTSVESIASLIGINNPQPGRQISVASYHVGAGKGGGILKFQSVARHDGVINFDPTRAFPTDWSDSVQVAAWYADSGVDAPCWVRVNNSVLSVLEAGAIYNDDSSYAFQALEDAYESVGGFIAEYPNGIFIITKPIQYVSGLVRNFKCLIQGTGAFTDFYTPKNTAKWATSAGEFNGLVCFDLDATADFGGSTSTKRGLDLTGTTDVIVRSPKGVYLNSVLGADAVEVHQHTRRVKVHDPDASYCNWLFDFPPATTDVFCYGDIDILGAYTKGSVRYGGRCEDTDGFSYIGATMFPSAILTISGNYLTVSASKQFEPSETSYAVVAPVGVRVKDRIGGLNSFQVKIDVQVAKGGADGGFSGAGAVGVLIQNTFGLILVAGGNDPSQGFVTLDRVVNGTFMVTCTDANSQNILNPEPINTFNAVEMLACKEVVGQASASGTTHLYGVFMDDNCEGCHVDLAAEHGGVRIPSNGKNSYNWTRRASKISSNALGKNVIVISDNATTIDSKGWNEVTFVFSNSILTSVTDILNGEAYNKAHILIQDGVTELLASGSFVFKTQSFVVAGKMTGIDTAATFIRDNFGNWVEI